MLPSFVLIHLCSIQVQFISGAAMRCLSLDLCSSITAYTTHAHTVNFWGAKKRDKKVLAEF